PLLQALVLLPFRAPIAERVGEEAGHHGKGREIARHADVVDPDTAEGDERRLEVNDEPAMLLRHSALPSLSQPPIRPAWRASISRCRRSALPRTSAGAPRRWHRPGRMP